MSDQLSGYWFLRIGGAPIDAVSFLLYCFCLFNFKDNFGVNRNCLILIILDYTCGIS